MHRKLTSQNHVTDRHIAYTVCAAADEDEDEDAVTS